MANGNAPRARLGEDGAWLAGLCAARVGFATIFMTYAATLPLLQADWEMTASQAGLIHSAFHIGYLTSLFSVGFLADRYGAKRVFLASSIAASVSAFAFAVFAHDFVTGFFLYGATALFSGGSYTPVLTLIAQRFDANQRGRAIGFYIAAAQMGYGASLLLSGLMIGVGGWRSAFYVTGAGPLLGTVLAFWAMRKSPNVIPPPPPPEAQAQGRARSLLANRGAVLIVLGYTFHSWELLGMRAWLPAFLAVAMLTATGDTVRAAGLGAALSAGMFMVSMGANILAGGLSDKLGRTNVILAMAVASLVCSFSIGWLVGAPIWLVIALGAIYHFTGVGDSPVLSTALTELVEPRYLGAAYSVRSVLGFGAGAISPWVFGIVLDITQGGASGASMTAWGMAFVSLGLGGLPGPLGALWLRRLPDARKLAGGKG